MSLIGNIRHSSWFRGYLLVGLDVARPELAQWTSVTDWRDTNKEK